MTRVDFYLLPGTLPTDRLHLICKLSEKAMGRAQKVFIYSDKADELLALDRCLWDFRDVSFVAHKLMPAGHIASSTDDEPVQLSLCEPGNDRTVLINLAEQVPPFFSRFERTLEVVDETPAIKSSGRLRYRFYQERGYPLQHHRM